MALPWEDGGDAVAPAFLDSRKNAQLVVHQDVVIGGTRQSSILLSMKYLLVLNDSPYGSQRTYNGLRLAGNLCRSSENRVRVFLLGDGATAAFEGFTPAHAYYNTQDMLRQLGERGVHIGVCKTCLEARGILDQHLVAAAKRSTLDDLTRWTEEADKVLVF